MDNINVTEVEKEVVEDTVNVVVFIPDEDLLGDDEEVEE